MSIFDDIKDVIDFERVNLRRMGRQVKEDPERLLLGAADPFGTKLWGGITGQDWEPIVNQWGGATEEAYAEAEAKGVDTGPGRFMHQVAQSIASMYAAGYGAGKIKAFGKKQGWPDEAVDAALRQAQSAGRGGGGTFQQGTGELPPPRPQRPTSPPPTFEVAQPPVQTSAPAPAQLQSQPAFRPIRR